MMFRLIFTALVVYLGYRYLMNLWKRAYKSTNSDVKGEKKEKPLDLDNKKIVDAQFEDIDEEGNDS